MFSEIWKEHWPIEHFFQLRVVYQHTTDTKGREATQLVEAPRYKLEGHGFDSRGGCFIDKPSGRTMALGLTQPLTEMSTRNISRGEGGRKDGGYLGLTTLPPSYADSLEVLVALTSWNTQGLSRPFQLHTTGKLKQFSDSKFHWNTLKHLLVTPLTPCGKPVP